MKPKLFLLCVFVLIVLVACAAPTPTATPVPPTATAIPPTLTPVPPVPTAIPLLPTPTFVLPTPTADAVMTLTASRVQAGIELGALAPDFSLTDTSGKTVNLAEVASKHRNVVVFYYYSEG